MFSIYQKYIIISFFKKFFKVTLIFLSLTFIMGILEEINFFKDINVNFFFPYLLNFLNIPITLFEIFPFIILISTQLFFYEIFKNDELNLLKINGLSNLKIVNIIFIMSFLIGIFNFVIYYNFASKLKFHYSDIKNHLSNDNKYLAMVTESGLWIKDEINGKKYIVKSLLINNNHLYENIINEFNNDFKLLRTIQSKEIDITSKKWVIKNPSISIKNTNEVIDGNLDLLTNYDSKKIKSIFSNISTLDMKKLYNLKKDYEKFGYSTDDIMIQIYRLYTTPFLYGIIALFSMMIMFQISKDKSLLYHIVMGVVASTIVYYINFIFNSLGNNGKIPVNVSIFFPLLILSLISIIGLININEK